MDSEKAFCALERFGMAGGPGKHNCPMCSWCTWRLRESDAGGSPPFPVSGGGGRRLPSLFMSEIKGPPFGSVGVEGPSSKIGERNEQRRDQTAVVY